MSILDECLDKIIQTQKQKSFKVFLKEICSWYPLTYYRNDGIISSYPETNRIKIIHVENFEQANIDLIKMGFEYNSKSLFFNNFKKLFSQIRFPHLMQSYVEGNCSYAEGSFIKNTYLSHSYKSEKILYSHLINNSYNVINSFGINNSDNIYMCSGLNKCFNTFYSNFIRNSGNIRFSTNLIGCQECIFCDNITNSFYCIKNQQLTKGEYFSEKEKILLQKNKFNLWYTSLNKKGNNVNSDNIEGTFIVNSKNINKGHYIKNTTNGNNLICLNGENRNIYSGFNIIDGKNIYCSINIITGEKVFNSISCDNAFMLLFCIFCTNCSYCFGCIGLKNKQYYIFNKKYSKKERYEKVEKILNKMEEENIIGNFFPGEINPYYFNDTVANLLGHFDQDVISKEGYLRRKESLKVDIPEGLKILKIKNIDKINFDYEILNYVIQDNDSNYYRIVKLECDFLKKYGLPIPEYHWLRRIKKVINIE